MPHIWSSKEFFFAEKMRRILLEIWKKITSNISIWDPTLRKIKACNFKSLQHKLQCQERRGLPPFKSFLHPSIWVRITTQNCTENPLILSFLPYFTIEIVYKTPYENGKK